MNKVEELIAATKLGEMMGMKKQEEKNNKTMWIVAVILGVIAVAGIAFALYKCFSSKCDDEFEDFEDEDFDDDFFEDEFAE